MMLPPHLTGSFKRYKANTLVFTTWLAQTAQACGYRIASCRKKGTKQPSIIEIDGAKRFTYPIDDIVRQAEAIAASGKDGLQLPSSIQRCAEDAVKGRLAFTDMLKSIRPDDFEDSKHAYFLDALKQALKILKAAKPQKTGPSHGRPSTLDVPGLSNLFEHLDVEDIESDVDDVVPPVPSEPSKAAGKQNTKGKQKAKAAETSEPETDEDDGKLEVQLRILGFFQDMHQVEDFVLSVWTDYSNQKAHLCTAALVTNAALALVDQEDTALQHELGITDKQTYRYHLCMVLAGRPGPSFLPPLKSTGALTCWITCTWTPS
ncbi:hypothetical protein GE09DRAFT_237517 [Coniochaeta sp. 2T2.1]|nr:hypothetical protein GE09DRAFT_237517 [Coniochaeta sp. 2T2.1]